MGNVIGRGSTFFGVSLTKARNALLAWRYGETEDAHRIAIRKDVELDVATVVALLDEFRERGLIGREEQEYGEPIDGLTDAGRAFVQARIKRVAKARGWKALGEVLEACRGINAREDLPFFVDEVWLFGSMLEEEKTEVGDVDLVVTTSMRPGYDIRTAHKRYDHLADELGINRSKGVLRYSAAGAVQSHLIYGARRNPLLAPNDLESLKRLACPTKLVFDRARGDRVDDPVLPRHPLSEGRSESVQPPLVLPGLTTLRRPIRPVSALLTDPRSWHWAPLEASGPWPPDSVEYRVVRRCIGPDYPSNYATFAIGPEGIPARFVRNVVLKRAGKRLAGLDGKYRFALVFGDEEPYQPFARGPRPERRFTPDAVLVVRRSVNERDGKALWQMTLEGEMRRGRSVDLGTVDAAVWWLHLIAKADSVKLVGRAAEVGIEPRLSMRVAAGRDDVLGAFVADELREHLGAFRTKPVGEAA
jgi:predicted nucleotidyltransferase